MVIGLLIYESIDILYHLGKMTCNAAKNVYYWYNPQKKRYDIQELYRRLEFLEEELRNMPKL